MLVANCFPDFLFFLVYKGARGPGAATIADIQDKVLDDLFTIGGMHHLRVKLDPKMGLFDIFYRGNGGILCMGDDFISFRQCGDVIAVAHPDGGAIGHAGKQICIVVYDQGSPPKFAARCLFNRCAKRMCNRLQAVANAQNR